MMDKRELSPEELSLVEKAIAIKELTSAEILMEVYDHNISHLERFDESQFKDQLFELEQKFTYSYCHALQAKFVKASKNELYQIHWSIWKSYFSWPRFIGTLVFLVLLTVLWSKVEGKGRGLALLMPMILMLFAYCWILIKSKMKVNKIKRAIGQTLKIQSYYLTNIIIQFTVLSGFLNIFIQLPKLFSAEEGFFESYYFIFISFLLCAFYIGHVLSLIEIWKIKSKTSLI